MLTYEQKQQYASIFEQLAKELDISETQYNAAVASYQAVGSHLSKEDSMRTLPTRNPTARIIHVGYNDSTN